MDKKNANILFLVLNVIGFLGTVAVNALAVILPLNNKTTAALSDQYPNLFVPAGLTFSIWGVIYILLAVFVVHHLVATVKNSEGGLAAIGKIGWLFFAASVLNMGWIFAWHYELLPLSLLIMLLLLGSLLVIYQRLGVGKRGATKREQYLVHLPFSVYLGWITIATIANVTALLVDAGWGRFGLSEQFWAVAVIIVGIAIAVGVLLRRRDIYYGLVVDWALLGILLKRLAAADAQAVVIISVIGMTLVTIGIIVQIARRRVYLNLAQP